MYRTHIRDTEAPPLLENLNFIYDTSSTVSKYVTQDTNHTHTYTHPGSTIPTAPFLHTSWKGADQYLPIYLPIDTSTYDTRKCYTIRFRSIDEQLSQRPTPIRDIYDIRKCCTRTTVLGFGPSMNGCPNARSHPTRPGICITNQPSISKFARQTPIYGKVNTVSSSVWSRSIKTYPTPCHSRLDWASSINHKKKSHNFHGRLPELDQLALEMGVLVLLHQQLSPKDRHLWGTTSTSCSLFVLNHVQVTWIA